MLEEAQLAQFVGSDENGGERSGGCPFLGGKKQVGLEAGSQQVAHHFWPFSHK